MLAVAIFISDGLEPGRRAFGKPVIEQADHFVGASGDGLRSDTGKAKRQKRKEAQAGRGRGQHAALSRQRCAWQKEYATWKV